VEVCPVDCIVPGTPESKYPWYYIDPESCIDCGACVTECPYDAIFTEYDVPNAYEARGGEFSSMPEGTSGYDKKYKGENHYGVEVNLKATKQLEAGEVVDLSDAMEVNREFFEEGPGYWDGWQDHAK
jgi:NAD-dependent dihydropyrimidine dehydrogenase PreA subunit